MFILLEKAGKNVHVMKTSAYTDKLRQKVEAKDIVFIEDGKTANGETRVITAFAQNETHAVCYKKD